jgi:hypothetical protein
MTLTELNPRPIWEESWRRESYWRKVQCARTCPGHILPFDRMNEVAGHQNIYPIDVNYWIVVREQELKAYHDLVNPTPPKKKKQYEPKNRNRKPIKIFGKIS